MTRKLTASALALALILALGACKDEVIQDLSPVAMTEETLGHYCQMNLLEHPGPKAQVHLAGLPGMPLFFSQVRDAIAYARAPEQMAPILAIYVSDMGAPGSSWDLPFDGNWIAAETAHFVLGSGREGGMGAPEAVPFASLDAARAFAAAEGGTVLSLAQIPDDAVLAPLESLAPDDDDEGSEALFQQRLRALSDAADG